MAMPFDLAKKQSTGRPSPVVDSVYANSVAGSGAAVSATGTIVYRRGTTNQLLLVDPRGSEAVVVAEAGSLILALARTSLAAAYCYTGCPRPLDYIALGEPTLVSCRGTARDGCS